MWLLWTLLACIGFGVGAAMQKYGVASRARDVSAAEFRKNWRAVLRGIAGNGVWIGGVLINLAGGGCFVLAVNGGQLSIVQPLVNSNVVIAMLIGVLALGERLKAAEARAAVLLAAGAVLLAVAGSGVDAGSAAQNLRNPQAVVGWLTAGCALLVASLFIARAGALKSRLSLETLLALCAGLLFGLGTVYLKLLTEQGSALLANPEDVAAGARMLSVVGSVPLWGVAGTNIAGFVLYQAAFSHGRVAVVSPLTNAAAVALPVIAGFWAYGESPTPLKCGGIALAAAGAILLAHAAAAPGSAVAADDVIARKTDR